jgi:hypothetical protein
MTRFPCPYLAGEVELTPERERHIAERHPDLPADCHGLIMKVLAEPDQVRRSARLGAAKLLSRWFDDLKGGKHAVVVVMSDVEPKRHWIITVYVTRKLAGGDVLWARR